MTLPAPDEDFDPKTYNPQDDIAKYASAPKPKGATKTRTRSTPRANSTLKTTGTVSLSEVQTSIEGMYKFLGTTLVIAPGDKTTLIGEAVAENAESCAAAYIDAANKDPKFAAFLQKAFKTGAYGGLVFAHLPILMACYQALNPPKTVPVEDQEPMPSFNPGLFNG